MPDEQSLQSINTEMDLQSIFQSKENVNSFIDRIEQEARSFVVEIDTFRGRADLKSLAYKIAKAKTQIDDAGKILVSGMKQQCKIVDESRREVRERLDNLKAEIRKPLTDWEESEKIRIKKEKIDAEIATCFEFAITENELFDLRKAEELRQQQAAEAEATRIAEEKRIDAIRVQKERDERIAAEAAGKAKREAEQAAEKAKREASEAAENAIMIAQEQAARAKAEQERSEEAAKYAAIKAEQDKEKAIQAERERAEAEAKRVERDRIAKEKAEHEIERKAAANKKHRKEIHIRALEALIINGVSEDIATTIVTLIAKNKITNVFFQY